MAEFVCHVDADVFFWTINDISVNQLGDPSIDPDDCPVVDGVRTEILRIMADVQYNNSMIQCHSRETVSDPAILMVQGMWFLLLSNLSQ